jgi:hypothetical protein
MRAPLNFSRQLAALLKLKRLKLELVLNVHMTDGIKRVVNGLPEENLGVSAALRDTRIETEPDAAPNAAPRIGGLNVSYEAYALCQVPKERSHLAPHDHIAR